MATAQQAVALSGDDLVLSYRPATVVHGVVSLPTRTHCPSASRPGHNVRAIDALTTITSALDFVSVGSIPRPRSSRVPIAAKYSGETAW